MRFHQNFKPDTFACNLRKWSLQRDRQIATARLDGRATFGWNMNLDTFRDPCNSIEPMKTSSHSRSTERTRTASRIEAIVRRFAPFCYLSVAMWAISRASKARYAMCVASDPMRAITTASQAGYAMCVAFVSMWAITRASQARYAMCVASRLFGFDVSPTSPSGSSTAAQPERGGERWRARPRCGGERGGLTGPIIHSVARHEIRLDYRNMQISDNQYLGKVFKSLRQKMNLWDVREILNEKTNAPIWGIVYVSNDESISSSWAQPQ